MPTEALFRDDAYRQDCDATVVARNGDGSIVLDRTVFYATSGGQPGDRGVLRTTSGRDIAITTASYTDPAKTAIVHIPVDAAAADLAVGETVRAAIEWPLRHARMRMHTALRLLSAVLPYPLAVQSTIPMAGSISKFLMPASTGTKSTPGSRR